MNQTNTYTSIRVTPVNPVIPAGVPLQFIATGTLSDGSTQDITTSVMWTSTNPSVCMISNASRSEGWATGSTTGTSNIQAILNDISGSTSLTVTQAILIAIQVTPTNSSIPAGLNQQFRAVGVFSDNTTQDLTHQVDWTSSDSTIASISTSPDSQGLATGINPGSATITASVYEITGSATLTVEQPD